MPAKLDFTLFVKVYHYSNECEFACGDDDP